MKKKTTVTIICALFIFLFVYTAANKLIDFQSFTLVLSQSPFIGNYAPVVAWIIPVTEIVIAALLFLPLTKRTGLYATIILMALFTGYIAYMIVFIPHLPCSCGGVIKYMSWRQHLIFNILCIVFALIGLRLMQIEQTGVILNKQGVS